MDYLRKGGKQVNDDKKPISVEEISKLDLSELQKLLEEKKKNRGNAMMPNASTVNKKKEHKQPREIF